MFIDVRKQKKLILKVNKFENLIVRVLTRTLGNKILDCCQSGVLSDIITHRGLNILYKLDKNSIWIRKLTIYLFLFVGEGEEGSPEPCRDPHLSRDEDIQQILKKLR